MNETQELIKPKLGTGMYTLSQAAGLIQVSPRKLRGWVKGYKNLRIDAVRISTPVIAPQAEDLGLLTFYELIELFFVKQFADVGVTLPKIKRAHELLREKWDTPYPFARNDLYTDGRELLSKSGADYEEVASTQKVFAYIELFFHNLDFGQDRMAECWWPLGRQELVVLDPARSFGSPIEVKSGIQTDVLYRAYEVEMQDIGAVAAWYEISEEAVEAAVRFEKEWRKAA